MNTRKQSVSAAPSIKLKPFSTNILDYPLNLSMYEKDSLASEARLAAERKKIKKQQAMIPPVV
jgi:hypothetical protein